MRMNQVRYNIMWKCRKLPSVDSFEMNILHINDGVYCVGIPAYHETDEY